MTQPDAWPQEQVDLLKELAAKGYSAGQIAIELNRSFHAGKSRNAVVGKCLRMELELKGKVGKPSTAKLPALAPAPKLSTRLKPRTKHLLPAVKSKPPIPEPKTPVAGEPHGVALPLMQRKRHQCGWPVDDGGPFLFCAQPKLEGDKDYCRYHRLLSLPAPRRAAFLREREARP